MTRGGRGGAGYLPQSHTSWQAGQEHFSTELSIYARPLPPPRKLYLTLELFVRCCPSVVFASQMLRARLVGQALRGAGKPAQWREERPCGRLGSSECPREEHQVGPSPTSIMHRSCIKCWFWFWSMAATMLLPRNMFRRSDT